MIVSKNNLPLDLKHIYWTENWKELRDYILLSLGYPIIRVELTEMHLNLAIRNAVREYINWEPMDLFTLYTSYDQDAFAIIPPSAQNIETALIHDVIFEGSNFYGFFGSAVPIENQYLGINQPFLLQDFDLVYYWQQRSKLEDMNQLLNLQRTWDIIDMKVKVYPTSRQSASQKIALIYSPINPPSVLEQDSWIQEAAVAEAKILWGSILGKFSQYTLGGGGVSVNADSVKSEGKEDKLRLLEDIKGRRRTLPMIQF